MQDRFGLRSRALMRVSFAHQVRGELEGDQFQHVREDNSSVTVEATRQIAGGDLTSFHAQKMVGRIQKGNYLQRRCGESLRKWE